MRQRLLLDVTKTFESGFATGIQRVVRELARRTDLIGERLDRDAVLVVASGGGYHRLDGPGVARLMTPAPAGEQSLVAQSGLIRRLKALLEANVWAYATMQRLTVARRLATLTRGLEPIAVRADDLVALIDYFGAGTPSVDAIVRARGTGATTIAIVYDIIPLLHGEMVPGTTGYPFKWAYKRLVPSVDGLIAISRSGADLVRAERTVQTANVPVASFYLGQDLQVVEGEPRGTTIPAAAWHDGPTFVMVGTIEPRKRHAATLAAFDTVWDAGHAANLVLVGRIGWDVDAFLDEARRHPRYGTSLFLCHQVDDRELHDAIARADATIMASKAEGFGLPIVESLALGVPVIAADIPIFREVAGTAGAYFLPDDTAAFAAAIIAFITHPEVYTAAARAFRWIDWDGSAAEFADAVDTIARARATRDGTGPPA